MESSPITIEALSVTSYAIIILMVIAIISATIFEASDLKKGLKGKDNKWQFIEWLAVIWFIIFTSTCILALLQWPIPKELWYELGTSLGFLVVGKGYIHNTDKKYENNNHDESLGSEGDG